MRYYWLEIRQIYLARVWTFAVYSQLTVTKLTLSFFCKFKSFLISLEGFWLLQTCIKTSLFKMPAFAFHSLFSLHIVKQRWVYSSSNCRRAPLFSQVLISSPDFFSLTLMSSRSRKEDRRCFWNTPVFVFLSSVVGGVNSGSTFFPPLGGAKSMSLLPHMCKRSVHQRLCT